MVRVILLGTVIALALALHFLPWWVVPLGFVLLVVVVRLTWRSLLMLPFRLKGKVLRGATATVASLQPCERPANAEATPEATKESAQWWQVEVTITPKGAPGAFKLWEPGELRLGARDGKAAGGGDDDRFPMAELELFLDVREGAALGDDGGALLHEGWHADQGWKLPGPRRLRFKFAAPSSARQLGFKYYFESFGALELPPTTASAAPN
jgi:hypothetical protein